MKLPVIDRFSTCKFKGNELKELVKCDTCAGNVKLKKFECKIFVETTYLKCKNCCKYDPK